MIGLVVSAAFWQQMFLHEPSNVRDTAFQKRILVPTMTHTSTRMNSASTPILKEMERKKEPLAFRKQEYVFVFAPHQDDGILCCSLSMQKNISRGTPVKVVYVTDGDALQGRGASAAKWYAQTRRREAQRAWHMLGLNKSDLLFLGFPDGHLQDLLPLKPIKSRFTGQIETPLGSYRSGVSYTRQELKDSSAQIFEYWTPSEVYIPSEVKDEHPDHKETARVVKEALSEKGLSPRILQYVVHGRDFPVAYDESRANPKKLELIRQFRSQFHDLYHRQFLEQFATVEEVFDQTLSKFVNR